MKFGVIVFPGSNCDRDCYYVIRDVLGQQVDYIWHGDDQIKGYGCLVLPGGFSYGDYLRTGAIARFSPVMKSVCEHARQGKLIMGICNGFQILLEAGLLPGTMMRNRTLRFTCKYVYLRVENNETVYTNGCEQGQILRMPIAHNEGNYYADAETLGLLKKNNQIVFRYCDQNGNICDEANPNGSMENIAGICNEEGNVLGMMPHPERCSEVILGSEDGRLIFESIVGS